MTSDEAIPSVGEIVTEFEHALRGARRASPGSLLSLLLELQDSNVDQWDLEDAARDLDASDSIIANAKRAIDERNLVRHRLMQEIDTAIVTNLRQSSSATLATESPGMAFDRLSVLTIRIARTTEKARSVSPEAGRYADRLPVLQLQLVALSQALEALLRDVRAGTRRFQPYEQLKLYAPRAEDSPGIESQTWRR